MTSTKQKISFTSIATFWYHEMAATLDGKQEHRSKLVNGFSAIGPRGIENRGTVPLSF